jgi:hypothetical protein
LAQESLLRQFHIALLVAAALAVEATIQQYSVAVVVAVVFAIPIL